MLVIILILGLCYSLTIAPDLTWAHFSTDGGDLITTAATGGVPHPSGYPLYLILARSFQLLPFGSLAFRTNFLSAVLTILATLVLYKFLLHHLKGHPRVNFIATFSALAFGLAPNIWGQALVTEVYALHELLIIACLYVVSLKKPYINEWACGFIFGIAATNHLTSVMVFPLILLDFKQELFVSTRVFLVRCLGVVSGLSLYLLLPLRAHSDSPVNWGNASTLDGFVWLVSGQLYSNYLFDLSFGDIIQRIQAFAGFLLEQYTFLGVLLGLYGLFCLPSHPLRIATIWIASTFLFFSLFYGSFDSQVNLSAVWLVFAIWLAYGLQDLLWLIHKHSKTEMAIIVFLVIGLMTRIPFSFQNVNLSGDFSARDFIEQTLNKIPQNSLAFLDGDQQIFTLWYAQFALHRRTDIVLVASGLLPYQWYIESLHHTYPDINLPEHNAYNVYNLINANPNRGVCYVSDNRVVTCTAPHAESGKFP